MRCFFCRACEGLWQSASAFASAQDNTNALAHADPQLEHLVEAAKLRDGRPTEAFRRFIEMAADGSVWSMLNVATAYERGDGVNRNEHRAEYWYRRAWKGGSDAAMLRLAELLTFSGRIEEAEAILAPAVEKESAVALRLLATLRLKAPRTQARDLEVRTLFERAVARGDEGAGLILGRQLARGRFGLRHIPAGVRLFAMTVERLKPAESVSLDQSDQDLLLNKVERPTIRRPAFGV